MKKSLILIALFLSFVPSVYAKKALLTGNDVGLRKGPGTKYDRITSLKVGSVYDFADEKLYPDEGGCSSGWYKINYNSNTTGYVCASYISEVDSSNSNATPANDCEKELSSLGFPSSYWKGLCSLKEKHSNWNFQPIHTNLNWSTVITKESNCGKSYIQTSNQEYIDSSCTSYYSQGWYTASKKAVAFYMDPRNWFDEKYIFQFEYLKYDSNLSNSYINGSKSIISKADFYTFHNGRGLDLASIINDAGSSTNVSPIFLSARMYQELGTTNAERDLYSGIYEGYNKSYYGYYNFFNYGVNDACATTYGRAYCGLSYAKSSSWNSPLNAIKGASNSLASSYINVGQYTSYLQKYNIIPNDVSKLYTHQYMTNVAAPSSEAKTTYNTYVKNNMLNNAFTFYIPVYINMDDTIINTGSGATGETFSESNAAINSVVTTSGYKYNSDAISGITVGTDVSEFISTLVAHGSNVSVSDKDGKSVSDGLLGTGFKVTISSGQYKETLEVVVKGDTSGDGKINALDLLQVQQQILGSYSLENIYKKAADPSGDGKVNALDLLQIQQQILGTYTIQQ